MSTTTAYEASTADTNQQPSIHPESSSASCVETFNGTVRELINELQVTFPELKDTIEERYTDMSTDDESVLLWFSENAKAHHMALTTKDESLFKENKALFLLPDINFSQLWKCKLTKANKNAIWKYLHVLLLVVSHYEVQNVTQKMVQQTTDVDSKDNTNATLSTESTNTPPTPNMQETFEQWNKLLDSNKLSEEDMQKMKEQSENIMKLMQNLHKSQDDTEDADDDADDDNEQDGGGNAKPSFEDIQNDPFVKKLEGSKIAQFAKELSTELNMNDLGLSEDAKMDSFQDVFGMMGKDPQKLFGLVQTVGNKIQSKMQHGDIQQNELVAEAHDLMQSMQGSQAFKNMFTSGKRKGKGSGGLDPHTLFKQMSKHMNFDPSQIDPAMMQQAMAMMGGMGANMPAGGATRSRLQNKLAQKQQHTDTCTPMPSAVSTTKNTCLPVKKKKKKKKKTVQHSQEPRTTD